MNYQFTLPEQCRRLRCRHRHYHHQHHHQSFFKQKCSLFITPPPIAAFGIVVVAFTAVLFLAFIEPASAQHHSLLNTPPVLYVSDRNWRIDENERVGQIISRIRAEDSENDDLVFGLEPHFHPNYANPNDDSEVSQHKIPFWIDPIEGVVYLNESLVGRAGENFFFYITVSDGQLTAKNEIFVNILGKRDRKNAASRGGGGQSPPTFSNIVQNITQFLPSFDQLPGVQSIRNQHPSNRSPFNSLPPGFGMNSNGGAIYPPLLNFNPNNPQAPTWPTSTSTSNADSDNEHNDKDFESGEQQQKISIQTKQQKPTVSVTVTTPKTLMTTTTSRTKLTPISGNGSSSSNGGTGNDNANNNNKNSTSTTSQQRPTSLGGGDGGVGVGIVGDSASTTTDSTVAYSLKATMIPVIIAVCGLFVAGVLIFGFLYRKRLCAISKTLKKKSKEEMAKKSNQSNLSSNLTDDSHNSMVLQHWNGPTAYGNRYVPWERDQQQHQQQPPYLGGMSTATSTSTSARNSDAAVGNATDGDFNGFGGGGFGGIQGKKDRWEFPRHRLKFFNILGEGAFGQVWRCEATDIDGIEGITTVAVKTLKENSSEVDKKDLLSELDVMKSLAPHVNVVRFLGCCTDKDPIFVIIEYVNRGKLQTYLRNSRAERHYGNTHGKSNILTSGDLTSFMYQVAKGMDYLTSRGIIHRDLAARNILITDDHTCKIADFGFARDVITSKVYERKSEGKLPIRWMAIESLYDNLFSVKSDIWSFGILMWEIVTLGSTPYPGISAADVMKKVRDGYRLEKPEHCRRELYNIMYYCWSSNANDRPTFSEVVQMLDKLLHTEMDYIELERFPDHNYYNIVNPSGEKV